MAREEQQRQEQRGETRHNQEQGVTQCLTRCLVASCRAHARQEARRQPTRVRGGGNAGESVLDMMVMLLSKNRGLLYPALSHEAMCVLSRINTCPPEAVGVVGPLASALLLQPQCERKWSDILCPTGSGVALGVDVLPLVLVIRREAVKGWHLFILRNTSHFIMRYWCVWKRAPLPHPLTHSPTLPPALRRL